MSQVSEYLPTADMVPPHSIEAEQGVLGCLLQRPDECVRECLARMGASRGNFYDLRHQVIYDALVRMHADGVGIDLVTLAQRLRDLNELDRVGGVAYLATLADTVPSAANLKHYLDIVVDKAVLRKMIRTCAGFMERAYRYQGEVDALVEEIGREVQAVCGERRTASAPDRLLPVSAFDERVYDHFFNRRDDDYGFPLPFPFVMRLRPSEMTWFMGEQGAGKSTMLGLICCKVGQHLPKGKKVVFASMEVPCEVTLWIMVRQLMALPGRLERTEENIRKVVRALAWLNERVLLYDFLGIGDWRQLLATFEYAREHLGGELFVVDNFGRIGIADDDYAMQDIVSEKFFSFCVKTGAHLIMCDHENKGSGDGKKKIRGSGKKADHANNIVRIVRNEDKSESLAEIEAEVRAGTKTQKDLEEFIQRKRNIWDTKFVLLKQRWPGSPQNASHWLYFDKATLQLRNHPDDPPLDFLTPPMTPEQQKQRDLEEAAREMLRAREND